MKLKMMVTTVVATAVIGVAIKYYKKEVKEINDVCESSDIEWIKRSFENDEMNDVCRIIDAKIIEE